MPQRGNQMNVDVAGSERKGILSRRLQFEFIQRSSKILSLSNMQYLDYNNAGGMFRRWPKMSESSRR